MKASLAIVDKKGLTLVFTVRYSKLKLDKKINT